MKKFWAAVCLAVLAPLLGEALPGNTHFLSFVHPPIVLVFLVIVYGLPALLIREAAVRWNLSLIGVLLLGLAYGAYNEGIIAHTLFLNDTVPVPNFNQYGYAFGINFSWLPTILLYHTLHSVLYPILIASFLFSSVGRESWMGKKTMAVLALISFIIAPALFPSSFHPFIPQTLPVLGLIALLILAAWSFCKYDGFLANAEARAGWKPALLGVLYVVLFAASFTLAAVKVPLALYLGALALIAAGAYFALKKSAGITPAALLAFGLGDCIIIALMSLAANLRFPDMLAGELVLIAFFLVLLKLVQKRARPAARPATI